MEGLVLFLLVFILSRSERLRARFGFLTGAFLIGYGISYGIHFFDSAAVLSRDHGFELTRFFFLLTFAAAVPAIGTSVY